MSGSTGNRGRSTLATVVRAPIIWLAAVFVVFPSLVGLHTQAPLFALACPPNDSQQTNQSHQENCAPFKVLAVRSLSDLRLAIGQFIDTNKDDIAALSAVAVALFTFTLWLSTHRLWRAGERQLDAAILAQRAWIQITPYWATDVPPAAYAYGTVPPPPQFRFGSKLDNVGNMPASNLKNTINYILTKSELPDDFAFPYDGAPLPEAGVLGTKQFLMGPHIPRDRYITADEIRDMQAEALRLYLYGWVTYSDGFATTPRRTNRFCYSVRVTGNPNTPVTFIPHKNYNYAD
jgi:hypothetical protein